MASHIVVGVDFTEPSSTAARWVARHLAGEECELVLVHVISVPHVPSFLRSFYAPTEQLVEDARRGADIRLRELSESLDEVRARPEVRVGRVDEQLLDVAEDLHAELLVVGPHGGRPGLGRLLGSTAEHVARRADTSVLLARALPEGGPRTVLVALDESELTGPVLEWAAWFARRNDVRVIVLHVVNPLAHGAITIAAAAPERSRAEERLRTSAEAWVRERVGAFPLENAEIETRLGDVALEILGTAEKFGADLLIVGRNGAGGARRIFGGSVVEFILRNGTGAVLVVAAGPQQPR